uniref:Centriolin n=1 Tax=Zonotrichia albicollis TaxID=44394 RepID=A0A8D2N1Q3_ZONAL
MKAQKASKEQHLDIMNKHCQQLETRLDEMLSRIAKETEEIKDLEQQLTDGQIATNEALKRDLESVITGLQEYLQSVKQQAKQANEECKKLQKEKESLLGRLAGLEEDKNNLEVVAMDAENMRKEIAMLESSLQEQREINESLQGAQEKVSTHKAELEAQLRERDAEAKQQKEELERLKQLSQMELSALQDELEKERQLLENAQTKAQLAEEKEQQNYKLHLQFKQLQGDNNFLKQQLKDLQNQLNHAVGNLIHPEDVMACINELRKRLQTGAGEMKCPNSADILGKNLASLQKEFNDILADAQKEKEKAWAGQRQLQEELVSQQEKLEEMKEKYRQACIKQQKQNKVHQLENEIQCLNEKIKSMEEIQGLTDQQLQEADEEKEAILAQLEDLENRKKREDARAQVQVLSLDKELKELQRAVITSDRLAATELSMAAQQLKALQGTVLRIHQERAEELEEAQEFCAEAARASQALAKAEAERELLQQLLKEKEEQVGCLLCNVHLKTISTKKVIESNTFGFVSFKEIRAKEDGEGNAGSPVPEGSPFVPAPGTVIYTALPDGTPAPQGVGVSGPPPAAPAAPGSTIHGLAPLGSQVICGPLPANLTVPLIPLGVLLCNVPEHQDLESEVSRLEDTVCYLKSQKYKDKCSEAAEHKYRREVERLHGNVEVLEQERAELEGEVAELRRAAQSRSTHRDFVDGYTDGLLAELQLERSLLQQEDVAEEIECAEKTLLKRRAELREANRLLTEAQVELESTRGKTKETLQKYNRAKHHLSCTEMEAEELEQRAQETATKVVKATQQLRLLQTDTRGLEQLKREQECILKEINKMVAARDSELQSLNQKIEMLTESLQKLQGDIRLAEGNEGQHLQIIREAENLVQGKKTELETLKDQICTQKQELLLLEQQVTERTEELHGLQDCISQRKGDLEEALRDGETEAHEKLLQIREIKVLLGELSDEKNELDVQMNEKKAQLLVLKKDVRKEEENLQAILGQISKHKMELKHVLEMLELEKNELEGLKLQHEQKVNELERTQVALLEEKLKLENAQRVLQSQQGEVDWQEQLLRRDREEKEQLGSHLRALQSSVEALSREKERLQEDSRTLEKRLSQTKRDLTAAEDSSRTALSNMEKVELDVKNLQQEVELLNKQKKSLNAEIAAVQEDLQGKDQFLGLSSDTLEEKFCLKTHFELCGIKHSACSRVHRQKELNMLEGWTFHKLCLSYSLFAHEKREFLCSECGGFWQVLHRLKQNSEREGKKLEECAAKVKDQKMLLEKELTDQHKKLEQAKAKVRLAEENLGKLEKEESRCAALEEAIRKSSKKHQLSEKELQLQQKDREIQCLQKELEVSKSELKQLQGQIVSERREAEKQILNLKETQKMQRMELESKLQVKTQDLEERQREMESAATLLNLEVENEIRTGFKSSRSSSPAPSEDLESSVEGKRSLQCECDNSDTAPFPAADRQLLSLEEKFNISRFFLLDEQWRGEARREKLQQHEDRLKAQLRRCMAKQAEVLLQGKRQTAGSLHSLQRQLQVLDELVNSTASDSSCLASSPSLGSLHSLTKAQVMFCWHQGSHLGV